MTCFIQDLNLIFYLFLDTYLLWSASVRCQSLSVSTPTLGPAIASEICSLCLIYLTKECINANGTKSLVDTIADIVFRYGFNQVSYIMLSIFLIFDYLCLIWVYHFMISSNENPWIKNSDSLQHFFGAVYLITFNYLGNVIFLFAQ